MKADKCLQVLYEARQVGTLALTSGGKAAFEYEDSWIEEGFPISPFSLPLRKQVFVPQKDYFHGLFGVFADSLPDAWGNILLNRLLRRNGVDPGSLTVLDRLAIVGSSGMGALTYRPEYQVKLGGSESDLDQLAEQCRKVLLSDSVENLDELYRLGGTSGGARPKIMTQVDGEDWIIKFPSPTDDRDAGRTEYEYSLCAKKCGVEMSETRLFPSSRCAGYFGTKRFDRIKMGVGRTKKIHMLTAAALLELDFGQPSLDYHALMKLTKILTHDSSGDMENLFRRMCFNVFAHNRDDHSKNFAFLYKEETDQWCLSPAYDITYSTTYYGEHTITVNGEGADPGRRHLLAVGLEAGISRRRCMDMMDEVEERVREMPDFRLIARPPAPGNIFPDRSSPRWL